MQGLHNGVLQCPHDCQCASTELCEWLRLHLAASNTERHNVIASHATGSMVLRPLPFVCRVLPARPVPKGIPLPDWATTGVPMEEMQSPQQLHVPVRSDATLKKLRKACLLGRAALDEAHRHVKPGVTTDEIDRVKPLSSTSSSNTNMPPACACSCVRTLHVLCLTTIRAAYDVLPSMYQSCTQECTAFHLACVQTGWYRNAPKEHVPAYLDVPCRSSTISLLSTVHILRLYSTITFQRAFVQALTKSSVTGFQTPENWWKGTS